MYPVPTVGFTCVHALFYIALAWRVCAILYERVRSTPPPLLRALCDTIAAAAAAAAAAAGIQWDGTDMLMNWGWGFPHSKKTYSAGYGPYWQMSAESAYVKSKSKWKQELAVENSGGLNGGLGLWLVLVCLC